MCKIEHTLLFIATGLLFFLGNPATAQMPDYHIRVLDQKDGIQASRVIDMAMGNDGFLWLLYPDRVCRFDGRELKKFMMDERLISLEMGKDNELWLNSMDSLYKFENEARGFLPVEVDSTGKPQLISIIKLPNNKQRLLTDQGFYRYDPLENKFVLSRKLHSRINDGVYILTHSYGLKKHRFFYASNDTIFSLDLKTGKRKGLYVYDLYRFYPMDGHSLIASNWKGQSFVYDFSNSTVKPLDPEGILNPGKNGFVGIVGLCEIKKGVFLLSTYNNGIAKYNINDGHLEHLNLFFRGMPYSNFKTLDIYRDPKGTIWIASGAGLLTFNPDKPQIGLFRNWEKDPFTAFSDEVRNFAADGKGNFWLATLNGFARLDLKTWEVTTFLAAEGAKDRLNHPSIRGIVYDGKYLIIGQSNRGIWLYDPETKAYKRPPNTPILETDDFIDLIYTLQNGNHVIIAREEVYLMDKGTYRITAIDYPGEGENPVFCFQDKQGRVWVSANRKLYVFDNKMNYQFTLAHTFENSILSMCQVKENVFFFASRDLYKLTLQGKRPSVEKIDVFQEKQLIAIIYNDTAGKLWMASETGVFSYQLNSGKIEQYGYYDNVQSGRFYINSYYRFPDGMLFLGGIGGINYFYPEKMEGHDDSLVVSLLQVSVNRDIVASYPDFSSYDLNHTQKNVNIAFSAPYFNNPNRVRYRYKMEGLENENWVLNGKNNSVQFVSLAPGDYSFRVAASINGEDWYESRTPLYFSISPPFWETWWFRALVLLLIGTTIYFWIRSLRTRIREERILTSFATSLFGQNTVEETFWDVAQNCIFLLGFEDCVIYQYDEQAKKLIQIAAAGPKGNPVKHKIYGAIEIPLGKGIVGTTAKTQRPEIVKDTRKDPRYIMDDQKRLSEISVPIIVDGKTYGVIDSEHPEKGFHTKWHMRMLEKIARLCSEKISKYLIAEEIRSKIAQDLHDDMGSTLTSINIISKIAMDQGNGDEKVRNHLQKIKTHSGQMMESMDDIIWAINPEHDSMEQIGLHMKEYASELLDDTGIAYSFRLGKNIEKTRFDLSTRKELFLVFKEALNNAVKYSKASKIRICMKKQANTILLTIKDNGLGFDTEACPKGNGLKNMKARAEEIQGNLQIDSAEGKGTAILLKMPIT